MGAAKGKRSIPGVGIFEVFTEKVSYEPGLAKGEFQLEEVEKRGILSKKSNKQS